MAEGTDRTEHFQWLVDGRHRNQTSSLQLRLLLRDHEKRWKTSRLSMAAQELISISFSLWRAVFLAEKTGKRAAVFDDGFKFLERVIEDNSIAYAQDKAMREWSFNYYTKSARYSLEYIHRLWPDVSPEYQHATRKPKERWEYCQGLLDEAIQQFRIYLDRPVKVKVSPSRAKQGKARSKKQTKANRKTVRTLQLGNDSTLKNN